jgi:1-aminocyclopropane-1-carboxylate deaminase/D-cysteine desulfhydrase-like pyridoxal-dependent ACC family enzyme
VIYQKINTADPVQLTIKRLDLIHPQISGNKFYKLKYNLIEARRLGLDTLLSFGGAYSNHIAATAYAAQRFGFKSIGIIRGEELAHRPLNPTLDTAQQLGMQLHFVSRENYKKKQEIEYLSQLQMQFPNSYIIPEGGSNDFALQGTREILSPVDKFNYDIICCAVGTGTTLAGLIEASQENQTVLGFSALKGDFLTQTVQGYTVKDNWRITDDYCFGGYAKSSVELRDFIQKFEQEQQIPLEAIYTGKMLYGVFDLLKQGHFPAHHRILLIHSGGLQGRTQLTYST